MMRFTSRLAVAALAAAVPVPVAAQGLTALRAGRLLDAEREKCAGFSWCW